MVVYVLVGEDKDGESTFAMPKHFGREVRAYTSKGRAQSMAKKFGVVAIELNVEDGIAV